MDVFIETPCETDTMTKPYDKKESGTDHIVAEHLIYDGEHVPLLATWFPGSLAPDTMLSIQLVPVTEITREETKVDLSNYHLSHVKLSFFLLLFFILLFTFFDR